MLQAGLWVLLPQLSLTSGFGAW